MLYYHLSHYLTINVYSFRYKIKNIECTDQKYYYYIVNSKFD